MVEPYLITLTKEAKPYTLFQHAGVEFIYMLTGKVLYRHADKAYPLAPGDALFFDSAALHGPEELTELPMTYLSIIIYPRHNGIRAYMRLMWLNRPKHASNLFRCRKILFLSVDCPQAPAYVGTSLGYQCGRGCRMCGIVGLFLKNKALEPSSAK